MVGRIDARGLFRLRIFGVTRAVDDQLAAEQRLERFGQLIANVVLFEVDLLEERLIEQTADAGIGFHIARMAVTGVVERGAQVVLDHLDVHQAGLQANLDPGQLLGDTVLLVFHEIERDGSGVVGLEQLGSLIEQALLLLIQLSGFAIRSLATGRQFTPQAGFDLFAQFRGELDDLVFIFDQFFDALDQHRLPLAVIALLVATETHEVWVDRAMPVLGVGDDEPAVAATTEHGRFEVVRVVALLLSVDP